MAPGGTCDRWAVDDGVRVTCSPITQSRTRSRPGIHLAHKPDQCRQWRNWLWYILCETCYFYRSWAAHGARIKSQYFAGPKLISTLNAVYFLNVSNKFRWPGRAGPGQAGWKVRDEVNQQASCVWSGGPDLGKKDGFRRGWLCRCRHRNLHKASDFHSRPPPGATRKVLFCIWSSGVRIKHVCHGPDTIVARSTPNAERRTPNCTVKYPPITIKTMIAMFAVLMRGTPKRRQQKHPTTK